MGGNSLGQVYTLSLSCVYGRVEVRCGQVRLTTRHPSLVDGRQVLSGPPGCEVADRRKKTKHFMAFFILNLVIDMVVAARALAELQLVSVFARMLSISAPCHPI